MSFRVPAATLVAAALLSAGCSGGTDASLPEPDREATTAPSAAPSAAAPSPSSAPSDEELPPGVSEPPAWLGKRVLPRGPDGFGIARATPPLLRNRRLTTKDVLPPPPGERFLSSIRTVPKQVLRRSTWQPSCPVKAADLAYVNVSFWGFDRRPHTGELLVHKEVAKDVVSVFRSLHRARWPIEEMRITRAAELDAPPTGDGNNTGAFACRPARLSDDWSEHAYGLAVDINPFHNPYVRDDIVLPERAIAYRNRSWRRPGMIFPGDVVTRSFARIGWGWGGDWTSSKDRMHFSRSGG